MPDETKPAATEPEKSSFLTMFRSLEDGILDSDLTDEMVQLVHDMRAHQMATGAKPRAKIALTLEIKLDGGIFEVIPSYKVTPPKKPRSRSIFYPTKDGGLSTQNHAQMNLGLKAPAKDVTSGRPMAVVS